MLAAQTVRNGHPSTLGPLNLGWAVCAVVVNMALIAAHSLYLARVCSVRTTEVQGLARSVLGASLALLLLETLSGAPLPLREVWLSGACSFALLVIGRGAFTGWLRRNRAAGRFVRDVVLVGADVDAVELAAVMREHPELGFRPSGYLGASGFADVIEAPHLGAVTDVVDVVERTAATGVVLIASALPADVLNTIARRLLDQGVHVHLSSGLRGIAHQRFRATPLAHEPLVYLEPASLTPWQVACKRMIDVIGAVVGMIITAPIMLLAVLAIKLESPGPALFRQERVGRNGERFTFLKLRTMVNNAEALRAEIETHNQRISGPLFKSADDPRITRVGRLLRTTSIDELPQLWNVLQGTMSLVGPRPALPSEVAQFDEKLRARLSVAPGLTGLWQIEARDNPSFGPYRRLDLFYVENWSAWLDIRILFTTIVRVVHRATRVARRADDIKAGAAPSVVLD